MALDSQLLSTLQTALESAYPDPNVLDTFLGQHWGKDLGSLVPDNLARPERYARLIRRVYGEGWVLNFAERLRDTFPDSALVQACWDRFKQGTGSTSSNPFHACLLSQVLPCWDRKKLRDSAEDLLTGHGRRVLLVDGPPQCGKTFTRFFINHVAPLHAVEPYYLDMTAKNAVGAAPDAVARKIALSFHWGLGDIPQKHAQAMQWAEEVGEWIVGNVRQGDVTVLLIFDNCSGAGVLPETRELLVYLAGRAVEIVRLRVTLLDHKDDLEDPATRDFRHREDITPPTKTDFYTFVAAYAEFKGYTKVTLQQINRLVDSIWDPLVKDHPIQLGELKKGAEIAMDRLKQLHLA